MQPQLAWAGLPPLEQGVSCFRATGTTSAIAEQGSELLLFLLYNDISCRSEVTWVVFEMSELIEKRPTATLKYVDLSTCATRLHCGSLTSELAKLDMLEHLT